jgi:riboflavin biosynthesis pyrimidine reductase
MRTWAARFDAFVRRKEREAAGADLSPFHTEEVGQTAGLLTIGNAWTRRPFDGDFYASPPPADIPASNLVFVQSSDGNTGAADPSTLGGGATDKHVVYEGLSRVAADAVMAGAETIRGGDIAFSVWHPEFVRLRAALGLPRHPIQIVATLRGLAFDQTLFYNVSDLRVVLLTVPACVEAMRRDLAVRSWITPVVMKHATDLRTAFGELRRLGINRVSAIGGRTIARALIDAGLIHDLYLTTSARPGGEPNTPFYPKPLAGTLVVSKRGTGPDTGVAFRHSVLSAAARLISQHHLSFFHRASAAFRAI